MLCLIILSIQVVRPQPHCAECRISGISIGRGSQPEDRRLWVNVRDGDGDAGGIEPYLTVCNDLGLDPAIVTTAMVRDLLMVGPDDQVMT
jgi:hypothetical protein